MSINFSFSNSWSLALPFVHPGRCHATEDACHIRRRLESITSSCSRWIGTYIKICINAFNRFEFQFQAVDVVGQAGKPKTITGFQTHTTPVLLAHGERAELATEEYISLTPIMEGFVILRKNPDFNP